MIKIPAILCALALSACATASIPIAERDGLQAMIVAEYAYDGAASAVIAAHHAGLIHGATATRIKALNDRALAVLAAGKAASDNAKRLADAAEVASVVLQINSLIPKG